MENKVDFKQIDKLGDQKPSKAIWKGFLFHYYNNPKIILTAIAFLFIFILLLVHPDLVNPTIMITGFIKLKSFYTRP